MMKKSVLKCPLCNELYPGAYDSCPKCGYEKPKDGFSWIFPNFGGFFGCIRLLIFLFCIAIIIDMPSKFGINIFRQISFLENKVEKIKILYRNTDGNVVIDLNSAIELSGLSKDEIYRLRKQYVVESVVFSKIKKYEPNPNIFQIEDNLPWVSAYQLAKYGAKNNESIGKGISSVSISVVNPELLFSFLVVGLNGRSDDAFSEYDYFFPSSLEWDDKNNMIIAKFPISEFRKRNPRHLNIYYILNETNARDFGYNWVYCPDYQNIEFENRFINIASEPYQMKGFYHKGYSCGLPSGCNNYSPYQESMNFKLLSDYGELTFKLWKQKPFSVFAYPDITYKMIFI